MYESLANELSKKLLMVKAVVVSLPRYFVNQVESTVWLSKGPALTELVSRLALSRKRMEKKPGAEKTFLEKGICPIPAEAGVKAF